MKAILKSTLQEYSKLAYEKTLTTQHLSRVHSDIKDITISTTGPQKLMQVVAGYDKKSEGKNLALSVSGTKVLLCRVRDGGDVLSDELELTIPLPNTRGWLNVKLIGFNGKIDLAYQTALEVIDYEIEHFKILTLDEHINHFSKSLEIPESEVANNLIKRIIASNLLKKPIYFNRLSFKYPMTINLCGLIDRYQPSCMKIYKIPAKFAGGVLDSEISLSVLTNDLNMSLTYCDVHKVSLLDIYTGVPEDIVLRMAGQIKEGLNYISRILDNIDKFPIESKMMFCNILLGDGTIEGATLDNIKSHGVLQVYEHFCEIFNKMPQPLLQEEKRQLQELKGRVVALKDQFTQEKDIQMAHISQDINPNVSKPNEERSFNKK